ncbi:MAG: hypothetical protein IJZ79_01415 [Bacilli bacterium]|nr:hypothetical protein [Bacilli bacterium]
MTTEKQKLQLIEKLVNKWMQEENHPKCIDEIYDILHPSIETNSNLDTLNKEFFEELRMEQMEQM